MEQIFKVIEEKLLSQESIISVQKYEIERLKRELAERDKIIAEQTDIAEQRVIALEAQPVLNGNKEKEKENA